QIPEQSFIQARPYFASAQEPVDLVISNQECAKILARSTRRSVTADHEFLLINAFDFDPDPTATTWLVNGIALFADQSFQSAALDLGHQIGSASAELTREAEQVAPFRHDSGEQLLALSEGERKQAAPVQL